MKLTTIQYNRFRTNVTFGESKHQRKGQFLVNSLSYDYYETYRTDPVFLTVDCFYKDELIPNFLGTILTEAQMQDFFENVWPSLQVRKFQH